MTDIITRKEALAKGLKRYFTGKPCKHGHISERTASGCIECHNILSQDKYHQNIEAEHARSAKYHAANKERARLYGLKHRAKNSDKLKAVRKAYKAANRQEIAAKAKIYNAAARDKIAERKKKYYSENREQYRVYVRNRRAMMREAEGVHTADDVLKILAQQKWLCAEPTCRADLRKIKRHVDHIMPLSLGGSNWPSNLQCLCHACNRSKWAKTPEQWAQQNGRLL